MTKLAASMTPTTFDSPVSELSQELYYVDAAIASMRMDAQQQACFGALSALMWSGLAAAWRV